MSQNRVTVPTAALALLAACLAAPPPARGKGAAGCAETIREQVLQSTGADVDASARARFRQRDDCRSDFNIEVEDVPIGDYELFVGGVLRGTITVVVVAGGTKGEIQFESPAEEQHSITLNFDPLGATIEIRRAGVIFFLDVFDGESQAPATSSPTPTSTPSEVRRADATRTATVARTATPPRTPTTARTVTPTRARTRTITPTRILGLR